MRKEVNERQYVPQMDCTMQCSLCRSKRLTSFHAGEASSRYHRGLTIKTLKDHRTTNHRSPHVSVIESFSGQAKQVRVTVGVASIQMALQVRASANESDDVPRGERSETSETSQSLKCWDHVEMPRQT